MILRISPNFEDSVILLLSERHKAVNGCSNLHRIPEYPELERTHTIIEIQLLLHCGELIVLLIFFFPPGRVFFIPGEAKKKRKKKYIKPQKVLVIVARVQSWSPPSLPFLSISQLSERKRHNE